MSQPQIRKHLGISTVRFDGMVREILRKPNDRPKHLAEIWNKVVVVQPELRAVTAVDFFIDTVSVIPEQQNAPPLDQKLLFRLTLP